MTNNERKIFWERLCLLPDNNIDNELAYLNETIIFPPAIYRYRAVSENALNALENNQLFFSTAEYYDDPFDTYINIDYDLIRAQIEDGMDPELFISRFKERWSNTGLPLPPDKILEEFKAYILNNEEKHIESFFRFLKKDVQVALQQRIWSVCFCESPINPTMWIKYGAQNKGFCLMYSLKESDLVRLHCGSEAICDQCNVKQYGLELFPVFYSQDHYDATSTAFEIVQGYVQCLTKGISSISVKDVAQWWEFSRWSLEKVALIKSIYHEHDEEWRLLFTGHTTNRIQCKWIPSAVILGLKMSDEDKKTVKNAAKKAGISKIYTVEINQKGNYELIEEPF